MYCPPRLIKLDNLSKTVGASARNVLSGRLRRRAASGLNWEQNSFVEIKRVPVVINSGLFVCVYVCMYVFLSILITFFLSLTFLLLTIFLRHGSVGTHIRGSRQYTCQTARNLFSCYCAKTYRNTSTFYKVIEKKVCSFFETAYCCREWRRYKSVQYKSISTIVNADILV